MYVCMYVCMYIYIHVFFLRNLPFFGLKHRPICNPPWLKSASINKAAKDKGHKARCGQMPGSTCPSSFAFSWCK